MLCGLTPEQKLMIFIFWVLLGHIFQQSHTILHVLGLNYVFLMQHPWSTTIRIAIDLEAMGIGGKSGIFQVYLSESIYLLLLIFALPFD